MALRYKVLEKFSREAREYAAARVYNQERYGALVCEDGRCVMANLLLIDKHEDIYTPSDYRVCDMLGYSASGTYGREIRRIIKMNDQGKLATPEAVRALLLDEEA